MPRRISNRPAPVVVGVIDLLNGDAVHAVGGDRRTYAPVRMRGIDGDPSHLARFYTATLGVEHVYVADLDAIGGGEWQSDRIRQIRAQTGSLWLDAGVSSVADASRARLLGAARIVVGLETLLSFDALRDVCDAAAGDIALSLDLRDGRIVTRAGGIASDTPPHVIAATAAALGVRAIIVLDLSRVGRQGGCDLETIGTVRRAAPQVTLLAGGGIRDAADLARIAQLGCDGALVATALLTGTLRMDGAQGTD